MCGKEGTKKELILVYIKPENKGGWKVYLCEECFNNLKQNLGFS